MPRTQNPSSDSSRLAVETHDLGRVYKTRNETVTALTSVDLNVREGELYGVLGPNGAGKTTLIKILVTLLLPTSGTASVDGLDVVKDFRKLRPRISIVSGGENAGYGILYVREQLWMFSQFYGMSSKVAYARIDELLERLGLASVAKRQISGLSSGMRQKMNLVRGLMTDPRVLFLDEPTVALDVGAARDLREEVSRWMAEDPTRTVILTTHYMQEADDLCDRIAIVNRGQIVIEGTPQSLKLEVPRDVILDLRRGGRVVPTDHVWAVVFLTQLVLVQGSGLRAGESVWPHHRRRLAIVKFPVRLDPALEVAVARQHLDDG